MAGMREGARGRGWRVSGVKRSGELRPWGWNSVCWVEEAGSRVVGFVIMVAVASVVAAAVAAAAVGCVSWVVAWVS